MLNAYKYVLELASLVPVGAQKGFGGKRLQKHGSPNHEPPCIVCEEGHPCRCSSLLSFLPSLFATLSCRELHRNANYLLICWRQVEEVVDSEGGEPLPCSKSHLPPTWSLGREVGREKWAGSWPSLRQLFHTDWLPALSLFCLQCAWGKGSGCPAIAKEQLHWVPYLKSLWGPWLKTVWKNLRSEMDRDLCPASWCHGLHGIIGQASMSSSSSPSLSSYYACCHRGPLGIT